MKNDSITTLRRIAYLLERNGAETYKVRAFRNAADAIAEIAHDKLITMSPRELVSIPRVGKTSASVITEILFGETSSYLAELEGEPVSTISPAAAEICNRLRGDCHSHSDWSDDGGSIREMAESAKEFGHEYWALTDHSPRLSIAHGLNQERLRKQLDVVAELNAEPLPSAFSLTLRWISSKTALSTKVKTSLLSSMSWLQASIRSFEWTAPR